MQAVQIAAHPAYWQRKCDKMAGTFDEGDVVNTAWKVDHIFVPSRHKNGPLDPLGQRSSSSCSLLQTCLSLPRIS